MSGGVASGSPVSAGNTNAAFLEKNADDATVGKVALNNPDPISGGNVVNTQREINSIDSFTGNIPGSVYDVKPIWTNNDVGASTDDLKTRADLTTYKFNSSTGHLHSGVAGDAPPIPATNIASVELKSAIVQGTSIASIASTSTSVDVSSLMGANIPSNNVTTKGWVVNAPYNQIILRQSDGTDILHTPTGEIVYGRLTYSASVWTITFYYMSAGVETSYAFQSTLTNVQWFSQVLINPLTDSGYNYNELLVTPSTDATTDVVDASPTQRGVVNVTTQSFAGNKTFTGAISASNLTGTNTGNVTLAAVGSSPNANAASLSGQVLNLQPADATNPGLMSALAQAFGGAKTFNSDVIEKGIIAFDHVADTTAGTLVTLAVPTKVVTRLTNASLISVYSMTASTTDQFSVIVNATTVSVIIKNGFGISTGTGSDYTFANDTSIWLWYDLAGTTWRIIGGGGTGGTVIPTQGGTGITTYATGDMLYASATNVLSKLAAGTSAQVLTMGVSGVPLWKAPIVPYNYIDDGDFESNTVGGFSLGHATLSGGYPTTGITSGASSLNALAVTSSALKGNYALEVTSSGTVTAGHGIQCSFILDSEFLAQIMTIKFAYSIVGGTIVYTNDSTASFAVGVYNNTNSQWVSIMPAQFSAINNSFGICNLQFQAMRTGTSYTLFLFAQNAITGPLDLIVDDFSVAPQQFPGYSTIQTDPVSYTPTFGSGFGTVTNIVSYYSQNGKYLKVFGSATIGTTASSLYSISLPSGLSLDTTLLKANTTSAGGTVVGKWGGNGTGSQGLILTAASTSSLLVYLGNNAAGTNTTIPFATSGLMTNADVFTFEFVVPILGWSSSSKIISSYDGRLVAFEAVSATASITSSYSDVSWTTSNNDSHAGYSAPNYTIPISGVFDFCGQLNISDASIAAGNIHTIGLYNTTTSTTIREMTWLSEGTNAGAVAVPFNFKGIKVTAGTQYKIQVKSTATTPAITASATLNFFSIVASSENQKILAGQRVSALAYMSANQSLTADTTALNFDTILFDSTNSITTGSGWAFTVPTDGDYEVNVVISSSSTSMYMYYVLLNDLTRIMPGAGAVNAAFSSCMVIHLKAGDKLQMRSHQTGTINQANATLGTTPVKTTYISIKQVN